MIRHTLLFVTFIQTNPGFAAWLIGGLFAIISALVVAFWATVTYRLKKLEDVDEALGVRVADVETTLKGYEEHIGAGDKMLEQLMNRVERHMTEEEDQVWGGMRDLGKQLSSIHEDNLKAHTMIVERLAKVEAKMPNGELGQILSRLDELTGKSTRKTRK